VGALSLHQIAIGEVFSTVVAWTGEGRSPRVFLLHFDHQLVRSLAWNQRIATMTPAEYEARRQATSAFARKVPARVEDTEITEAAQSSNPAVFLRARHLDWTDEQVATIAGIC